MTYQNSSCFFKMFFDKWYRPLRYQAIINKIDSYSNINEFRSVIMQNFHTFPKESIENATIFPSQVKQRNSDSIDNDENILLEKAYMQTFWNAFRLKMVAQLWFVGTLSYGVTSLYFRSFNMLFFRSLAVGGIII